MAFLLNEQSAPDADGDDPRIRRLIERLRNGPLAARQRALRQLVKLRAEPALTICLADADVAVVGLATNGLWEIWLSEKGPTARRRLLAGVELMEAGDYTDAEKIFLGLMAKYPKWAEAINKQATLLYLRRQPAVSLVLCKQVVALKPNHFGAWHGMALCAVELADWVTALAAAETAARLQPGTTVNREILELARTKLGYD